MNKQTRRAGPALGECSWRQTLTQIYWLDPENTGKGHQTANGKGAETTKCKRKPISSFTSGVSMSRSSQGRCLEPGGGEGFQCQGGLARKEPVLGGGGRISRARWPEEEGSPRWAPHVLPLQCPVDSTEPGVAE